MSDFIKYDFQTETPWNHGHPWNSQIENVIQEYALKNNLELPYNFGRRDYDFFRRENPEGTTSWKFVFYARSKTADDILREQIEFQIKELEK